MEVARRCQTRLLRCSIALAAALLSLCGGGCAIQTYDAKTGTAHLWGIGHLKMRVVPAEDNPKVQAIAVGAETIGVRLDTAEATSGLSLGYTNSSFVYVVASDTSLRLDTVRRDPFTLRLGTLPTGLDSPPPTDDSP